MDLRMFYLLILFFACGVKGLAVEERCSSAPYLSGDTFRAHADYIFDETGSNVDPEKIVFGNTIFVKTDRLAEFFEEVHPRIVQPYVLITHNSDYSVPGSHAGRLNEEKLLAWFGMNVEGCSHPKLHPLPIGLANHYWPHGKIEILEAVKEEMHSFSKEYLLYMNFAEGTNSSVRSKIYHQFADKPYCKVSPLKSFRDYLLDVQRSHFVLSPRGNGLDCHRTWEALYMGAIPIVSSSLIDPLFEGLPVVIVQDWKGVTPDFLAQKLEDVRNTSLNAQKLWTPYWFKRIDAYKKGMSRKSPYPIQISIPECKVVPAIPQKDQDFAFIIPGVPETYIFTEEEDYYKDYQRSYFAITCKKGGWDCMRHYEILANGCIPYFLDLEKCDKNTMPFLPRELILEAMHLEGVSYDRIDHERFDKRRYFEILEALLQHVRQHLTSEAIAQYVLDVIGYEGQGKILYLSDDLRPDYVRCCTLIGLKEILGDRVIDIPKIPHIYKSYPGNAAALYGKGFSYAKIVEDLPLDRKNIEERIWNKEFTHIIYGSVHRGLRFFDLVTAVYFPGQISYICGEEGHYCQYSHWPHLFLRESEDCTR